MTSQALCPRCGARLPPVPDSVLGCISCGWLAGTHISKPRATAADYIAESLRLWFLTGPGAFAADPRYGFAFHCNPWDRPKIACAIGRGARYWQRRKWWGRYLRLCNRLIRVTREAAEREFEKVYEVTAGFNAAGTMMVNVHGRRKFEPCPENIPISVEICP